MPRDAEDHIRDAVARGAISESRAEFWRGQAAAGADVSILDNLAVPHPAGRRGVAAGRPFRLDAAARRAGPDSLVAEMRAARPALVSAAEAEAPEPRLFGDRDLPPLTASGIPPETLASLPWQARRPVAEAPTAAAAFELAEQAGSELGLAELAGHPANAGYVGAVRSWLAGTGGKAEGDAVAASAPSDYDVEALHKELFGDH